MPIIRYTCKCGESQKHFYRAGADAPAFLICKCGLEAERVLSGPNGIDTKIKVDNGVQARSIEINTDHIKDNENRARFIEKLRNKP